MTVDAAIVAKPGIGKPAHVLLIQRKKPPCEVLLLSSHLELTILQLLAIPLQERRRVADIF